METVCISVFWRRAHVYCRRGKIIEGQVSPYVPHEIILGLTQVNIFSGFISRDHILKCIKKKCIQTLAFLAVNAE